MELSSATLHNSVNILENFVPSSPTQRSTASPAEHSVPDAEVPSATTKGVTVSEAPGAVEQHHQQHLDVCAVPDAIETKEQS